jgi:hypothetical protein
MGLKKLGADVLPKGGKITGEPGFRLPARNRFSYQIRSIVDTKYVASDRTAMTIPTVSVFIELSSIRTCHGISTPSSKHKTSHNQ